MSLKGEEALILSMNYTEESLEGAGGLKGEDGVSVVDMTIDASNHLITTLSDGKTIDAGEIPANETEIQNVVQNIFDTQLESSVQDAVSKNYATDEDIDNLW